MNLIGIDASLTSTGVASTTLYTVNSKLKGPQRLIDIREAVRTELKTTPDAVVAIEGYSMGSRNNHAHAIGELGGVLRVMMYEEGIPYVEIPPTCRAKFATGKGNAGKNEVVSSVSARTGIVWSGKGADDMCDAWILQECLYWKFGMQRYAWPVSHTDGLNKVDWTPILHLL